MKWRRRTKYNFFSDCPLEVCFVLRRCALCFGGQSPSWSPWRCRRRSRCWSLQGKTNRQGKPSFSFEYLCKILFCISLKHTLLYIFIRYSFAWMPFSSKTTYVIEGTFFQCKNFRHDPLSMYCKVLRLNVEKIQRFAFSVIRVYKDSEVL